MKLGPLLIRNRGLGALRGGSPIGANVEKNNRDVKDFAPPVAQSSGIPTETTEVSGQDPTGEAARGRRSPGPEPGGTVGARAAVLARRLARRRVDHRRDHPSAGDSVRRRRVAPDFRLCVAWWVLAHDRRVGAPRTGGPDRWESHSTTRQSGDPRAPPRPVEPRHGVLGTARADRRARRGVAHPTAAAPARWGAGGSELCETRGPSPRDRPRRRRRGARGGGRRCGGQLGTATLGRSWMPCGRCPRRPMPPRCWSCIACGGSSYASFSA